PIPGPQAGLPRCVRASHPGDPGGGGLGRPEDRRGAPEDLPGELIRGDRGMKTTVGYSRTTLMAAGLAGAVASAVVGAVVVGGGLLGRGGAVAAPASVGRRGAVDRVAAVVGVPALGLEGDEDGQPAVLRGDVHEQGAVLEGAVVSAEGTSG